MDPLLSVVVPVCNAEKTIQATINRINELPVEKEIIVVNDCSSDNTESILKSLSLDRLKVIHHVSTRGKLSALRSGLENSTGEFVIIQNGNLGLKPFDYLKLMKAMQETGADMVLGLEGAGKSGNYFLTAVLNIFFGAKLRGWFSHYQLIRRLSLMNIAGELKSQDFKFEIVTRALRKKMRIVEVPILND